MSNVVLITGTRKGLGRTLAEHFLKNGDTVIGCSRSPSDLKSENYTNHVLDIIDELAVAKMVRQIKKNEGKVDILINNAGIASMNHILLTPVSSARKIVDTNFLGCFILTREVGKLMKKNCYGRIINFTTVAAPLQLEGEAVYAASKAAVQNFTEVTAKEFADFGITVNAIGPTPIKTDLIKNVPTKKLTDLINRQTVKRFGTPSDVINVVDFFASKQSDFITGQTIFLGGVN